MASIVIYALVVLCLCHVYRVTAYLHAHSQCPPSAQRLSKFNGPHCPRRSSTMRLYGIFDDFKKIYSKENQDAIKLEKEAKQRAQMEAQKAILERRRNPKAMREYEERKDAERMKYAEERAVYKFQNKVEDGYDPLTDWQRLKDEGKIKIGKDLDRSQGKVLGSNDGLIDVRVDERMPYIDQGYVDTSSDFMSKFTSLFGKKGKDKQEGGEGDGKQK
jgi:hypothetical protein